MSSFSYENLPLHRACLDGQVDVVRVFLDAGANPNAVAIFDWGDAETLLIASVRARQPEVVQLLVDAGAEIDGDASRGQWTVIAGGNLPMVVEESPLEVAKGERFAEVRDILLKKKRSSQLERLEVKIEAQFSQQSAAAKVEKVGDQNQEKVTTEAEKEKASSSLVPSNLSQGGKKKKKKNNCSIN